PAFGRGKAAFGDARLLGPVPELRFRIVRGLPLGLVGDKELHHHLLRSDGAVARGLHLHADGGRALAGRGEHTLAFDLHHAGAGIAVGPVVRRARIAEMRNFLALAFGHLPDGLAGLGLDLLAVELELDLSHSAASLNSSGKYLITDVSGFEAAWPNPQIEASRIAWLNSSSNCRFQTGFSIRIAAFWVPTRQGVHWPALILEEAHQVQRSTSDAVVLRQDHDR